MIDGAGSRFFFLRETRDSDHTFLKRGGTADLFPPGGVQLPTYLLFGPPRGVPLFHLNAYISNRARFNTRAN